MITVHVPGYGDVSARVRIVNVYNQDGTGECHVYVDPILPPNGPDGGEPLPISDVA